MLLRNCVTFITISKPWIMQIMSIIFSLNISKWWGGKCYIFIIFRLKIDFLLKAFGYFAEINSATCLPTAPPTQIEINPLTFISTTICVRYLKLKRQLFSLWEQRKACEIMYDFFSALRIFPSTIWCFFSITI